MLSTQYCCAGEDRKNCPHHVVFLRLVHYTNARRTLDYLRFGEHNSYSDNLNRALPWLEALQARIRPQYARKCRSEQLLATVGVLARR